MPDAKDHLRQPHTLAHYVKQRDDWTWSRATSDGLLMWWNTE